MYNFYVSVVLILKFCDFVRNEGLVVDTQDGKIEGVYKESRNKTRYIAFESIPYAKPPVGDLRFEEAVPIEPWSGILKSRPSPVCTQFLHNPDDYSENNVLGVEDCLLLNIYTPTIDPNANLNVIFFIHAGVFTFGASVRFGPSLVMDRNDFIYVSVQFRVGILGFLSTENDVVPGNNCMRDQLLALKWVRNNIRAFGGNPDAITLAGASSGGASVHYHMLSPLSRGLFRNAISSSGVALNPWTHNGGDLERAKQLGGLLGCDGVNLKTMVECLKKVPVNKLVGQLGNFLDFLYLPIAPFSLVVDGSTSNPFLPNKPTEIMTKGEVYDVPWLVSFTEREGLYPVSELLSNESYFQILNKNWDKLAPSFLHTNFTVAPDLQSTVAYQVKEYYLNDNPISMDTFNGLVEMISDRYYRFGIEESIRLSQKVRKENIYLFEFGFRGEHSLTEKYTKTNINYGATHIDDFLYSFPPGWPIQDSENGIIQLMLEIITSFAKKGEPTIPGVDWKPACCVNENLTYLKINSDTNYKVEQRKTISNYEFWKSLPIGPW